MGQVRGYGPAGLVRVVHAVSDGPGTVRVVRHLARGLMAIKDRTLNDSA